MKIRTITCHDVYNVGASLQAYSLMKYLRDKGNDVKIIDYKPDYLSHHYQLFYVDNPAYRTNIVKKLIYSVAKFPTKLKQQKRKRIFDKFTSEYLDLTERYHSNEELKNANLDADLFIAGSDQIWNPIFENGKDPAFYLDFVKKGVKASYAASFAVKELPEELKETIKGYLEGFDYILVREKSGLDILKELGIKNGVEVLDPVFLNDKDVWNSITPSEKIENEAYALVYDFEYSEAVKQTAINIAKEKGYKIVSMFKRDYADVQYLNAGPLEFLNLIKNAETIVSNSFHATAFSLIFNKDFYVIGREQDVNSRMQDLLSNFCLQNRYSSNPILPQPSINYETINKLIEQKCQASKNYLSFILQGI